MKKKVVIALGHKALGTTFPEQKVAVKASARVLANLIENGCQLIISHSNAPQVGMIHTAMNEFAKSHSDYTEAPMSVCSAMSQGYIGYDLQNTLRGELIKRGISKTVSTILTQVLVDPYDEAFYHPIKVIGRKMNFAEAQQEEKKGNYVIPEGDGFRRIVAAPRPKEIIEKDAILALLEAGQIVIACGGGGIPVLQQGSELKGASAIIEKDYASGKLAETVQADDLVILTSDDKVYLNHTSDSPIPIDSMTVSQAQDYIVQNQFGEAAMLPKIEASVQFLLSGSGRRAIITNLENLEAAMEGRAGTLITE